LKRAVLFSFCLVLVIGFASCGGSNGSSQAPKPLLSGLTKRAFVSVRFSSPSTAIAIIDASKDGPATAHPVMSDLAGPATMVLSPNRKITGVFDTSNNAMSVIDNTKETVSSSLALGGATESFVILPDDNTLFVAVRSLGEVLVGDKAGNGSAVLHIPQVHWLAMTPDGKKILAFSDGIDSVTIINSSVTPAVIANTVPGFDRPVAAAFSSDSSTAYIMNCGAECGGATASVIALNLNTLALSAPVPVPAATIGLLNGGTLFVVGSPLGHVCSGTSTPCGVLSTVDTASLTSNAANQRDISDGYHYKIALASNNKIYIGARTCNNVTQGCLSAYSTSAQTVVISPPEGDVTGLQPISGRSVVYVIVGGELRIYDTGNDTKQANQIDIVGQAWDVVQPDP
jgi:hypothetical protein